MRSEYIQCEFEWYIAIWPDGIWCNWEDRYELTHRSDDYAKHKVLTWDPNGYIPGDTELIK